MDRLQQANKVLWRKS